MKFIFKVAGLHWFKLAIDPDEAEQCIDSDRLQKLYELMVVKFGADENAYFSLKQNYTTLCTPEKERYTKLTCKNDR